MKVISRLTTEQARARQARELDAIDAGKRDAGNIPERFGRLQAYACMQIVAVDRAHGLQSIATLRSLKSPNGTQRHATLFICARLADGQQYCVNGYGTAGGGGYCKRSASAGEAFTRAGIKFDESIDGRGENAMGEALEALARSLGFRKFIIVTN